MFVPSVYAISTSSDGPSHLPILHLIPSPSVSLSKISSETHSADFNPFLLLFSPFHLTINFESKDSSFSTNDVSSVTADFFYGCLRSYFTKEYPFVRTNVSEE